ncbi:ATP-dependent DNA ligase domain-containing protein [Rhizobium sp. Kim5]|nr:ATP-dependent DNA ligase domain-containing protein [Rhizobium sp. Kim5]
MFPVAVESIINLGQLLFKVLLMNCRHDKAASQAFPAAARRCRSAAPQPAAPEGDPAQHQLTLDPMPSRIDPCLALLKPRPPKGPRWAFEVKWDGYCLAVHIEPKGVRILTRGAHDWTDRFPAIVAEAKRLPVSTAILDGEAVVLDEHGRSDFGKLQQSLGGRGGNKAFREAILMVFDLLYLDGHHFTKTELTARRHLLEELVPAGGEDAIRLEEIEADGETLLRIACEHGLEGIIAKDRHSTVSVR